MRKRGQVTTFMIVGLVILIIFVLIFTLRDSILEGVKGTEGTKDILNGVIGEIDHKINDCIDKESNDALILLGKQGGSFDRNIYKNYKGNKINYLCISIPNSTKCENLGLTKLELQHELDNYLTNKIKNCINLESFRNDQRYLMSVGDFNLETNVLDKTVLFNITYPIRLERKGIKASVNGFSYSVSNPLGKMQEAVSDVLNIESETGDFDNVIYTLHKRNEFSVVQINYYPDKIYTVHYKDSQYVFQFAVKG